MEMKKKKNNNSSDDLFLIGFTVAISIPTYLLIDLISENNGDITAKAVPYILRICIHLFMLLHLLMRFRSK